jgi:CRISPR-associated protein Cmr4
MFRDAEPFYILVETPLHAGSGSELGVVDLPIQRERHTGFPKIESSGLKGSIRETFEGLREIELDGKKVNGDELIKAISLTFGPEPKKGDEHAGSLGFTDARILLFPVKSAKGIFAWVTCPKVLDRFQKELKLAKIENIPSIPPEDTVPEGCSLLISAKVVLEEYTFEVKKDNACTQLANWLSENVLPRDGSYKYLQDKMKRDIVALRDEEFCDFVTMATEVIARTKIDPKKGTVERRGLWYEEYLPAESVLYSLALTSPPMVADDNKKGIFKADSPEKEAEKVIKFFRAGIPEVIQIGGNQTIGKGIVRIIKGGQNEQRHR